ncbi:MAG: hypothetical protein OEW21_03955 [Betaproteobacteria bacterium]|nr:hypothetical protein [Betaproteobacteria bacterium]
MTNVAQALEKWHWFATRFDALPRERRMLAFVVALAVAAALGYLTVLAPIAESGRSAARELLSTQDEMRIAGERLQAIAAAHLRDPDAVLRQRLENSRARLAEIEKQVDQWRRQLISPDRMAGVLREILARNRGLELVEARSITPLPLTPAAPPQVSGNQMPEAAPRAPIYRHGLEVRVRGRYLDLLRYLGELERMPDRMFWREVEISAERYPQAVMRLTVYTLSLDKNYLSL